MTGVDPFKISAIVPDFEAIRDDYKVASNATRARYRSQLDIPYGPQPRQRLDLFFPPGEAWSRPVHMFIHGGYWRANVKEDYAFVAESVLACGAIAAIVEYTLMPGARMAALVDEVRRAAGWIAHNAASFGGDPQRVSASGHSAGAHLAYYLAAKGPHETAFPPAPVRSLLLISGIYDLEPIPQSFLQPELGLTADEVASWTPLDAELELQTSVTVAVGGDETAPFHQQAAALARRRGVEGATLPGLDHMTIVGELAEPLTAMGELMRRTIDASK